MSDQTPPSSSVSPSVAHIALWLESQQFPQETGFIYSLSVAIQAEGYRVSLVAPVGVDMSFLPGIGGTIIERPRPGKLLFRPAQRWTSTAVMDRLKATGVDVVLKFAPWKAREPQNALLQSEIAVVCWIWDTAELQAGPTSTMDKAPLIVSSQYMLDQCGLDRANISLIRPGILATDSQTPYHRPADRPACLVCLDSISNYQAFADLLDACRHLLDEKISFLLFLSDHGHETHSVWKLSGELDLLDRISFIPYRYDIDPLLAQADLYIQLTATSRLNYTTLRAMARQIPVLANPGPNDEFCINDQTCRVFEHGHPDMLAQRLREMLAHPGRTGEIATRAAGNVRRHYAMSGTIEQLIAVCRQASGFPLAMKNPTVSKT
jgi:glycosyltransferase involved in cell wall biosynthesis